MSNVPFGSGANNSRVATDLYNGMDSSLGHLHGLRHVNNVNLQVCLGVAGVMLRICKATPDARGTFLNFNERHREKTNQKKKSRRKCIIRVAVYARNATLRGVLVMKMENMQMRAENAWLHEKTP